ncbi:MAG TPA: DUF4118 domain-containing protein [Patescibacteria group bacterium]|nr:DUF4118 domain-containing protein [Patescibacteria group bacterium]
MKADFIKSIYISLTAELFVFLLRADLGSTIGIQAPFMLFFTAIVVSSFFGGTVTGIITTVLSGLIGLFFFLPPYNSFAVAGLDTGVKLVNFLLEGILLSFFVGYYAKSQKKNILFINTAALGKRFQEISLRKQFFSAFPQQIVRYFLYAFFLVFVFFTLRLFYDQVGLTSFVDSENNYIVGHFLLQGKTLYSQVFFNHQMLMAYVSYLIQLVTHSSTLYKLVFYHRAFVFLFSLLMDLLLIYRFRLVGVGFVLFYEIVKYYLFGNFFLAESLIVYPLVYVFGLAWEKVKKISHAPIELIIATIAVWFVVFMREPYIPLALFLYAVLLWDKKIDRTHFISILLFILLSCVTVFTVPLQDYFYQIVIVNVTNIIPVEIHKSGLQGIGILSIFVYFLSIFWGGTWNFFRFVLVGLDIIFMCELVLFIRRKKGKEVVLVLITLGLAAVRLVAPGTVFYGAFHLLVWIALFIFSLFLFLVDLSIEKYKSKIMTGIYLLLIISLCFLVFTFGWFFSSGETRAHQFNRNYGRFYVNGEVIKILAKPGNTLFVDLWDGLIYFVTGLPSSYVYSIYLPVERGIATFENERMRMFRTNPPDFYYTDCADNEILLPGFIRNQYMQLLQNSKPSCIFVKRSIVLHISKTKKYQLQQLGFSLPPVRKSNK